MVMVGQDRLQELGVGLRCHGESRRAGFMEVA